MAHSVLILGGRAPIALDHARRFKRHGWEVHVADSIPCRLSGWSSAVTHTHTLRPPRYDAPGFIADVVHLATRYRIDLVVPTCEEAFYLSRYRVALPKALHVAVDDFDKLASLHSKLQFISVAGAHALPVPPTTRVANIDEARDWAAGRAVVLKPEFSRFGVHVRLYPEGIPRDAPGLSPPHTWVAQEYVVGAELCSYAISDRGRLLAHAIYHPAYRLRRSSSYYFEPIVRPGIRDAIAAFVRGTRYTGQISFDWIESRQGGARVLECNPRGTSGLHLFPLDAGLPSALLGDGDLLEPSAPRARAIAALMRTDGLQVALRDGRVQQWARDCRRADDVISVPGDRLPFAGALADLGAYARLALQRHCSLREAGTRDIEWDGEPLPELEV